MAVSSKQSASSKQLYAVVTCASESESALKVREVTSGSGFLPLGCRPALRCYDLERLSSYKLDHVFQVRVVVCFNSLFLFGFWSVSRKGFHLHTTTHTELVQFLL